LILSRREFLLGSFAAALRGAAIDKNIVGANTAMDGYGLFAALEALARLKFKVVEIHPMGIPEATPGKFPGFQFDRISAEEKQRIKKSLTPFQRVTTHLPYSGLGPFHKDSQKREESLRTMQIALDATAFFGAELAVLHVVAPAGWTIEEARPSMIRQIREWGDFAAAHGFKIAIETGYPASVAEFSALLNGIDHRAIGCTIDVGHQRAYKELVARVTPEQRGTPEGIRAYNDTTHAIIDSLPGKIWHFHVHDVDPLTWQEHRPLGTGFVDYPRLIAKLRKMNYDGVLMLEIAAPGSKIEEYLADSKRRIEAYL
jgi:sugar phosphate isomerase/epimerase